MTQDASFIYNSKTKNVYSTLVSLLEGCSQFKISVAFITYGGVQILLDTLKDLEKRNIKGEVLTSTYLHFTDPKALERLASFSNLKLKIFVPGADFGFHTKGFLFKGDERGPDWTVLIGSSNLTSSALKCNMEWNILHSASETVNDSDKNLSSEILKEFDRLWESEFAKDYSTEFLDSYRKYLISHPKQSSESKELFTFDECIRPNRMQSEAITKLDKLRALGETKALAIAATGSGKTYMSVFDAMQFKPQKLLFIVHRGEILSKAKESFDDVIKATDSDYSSGFFNAKEKNKEAKYIFASRDTLVDHFEEFKEDAFDYIVVDEAHHATSPSYKRILDYFKPKFLLGLTATPERSDTGDVFSLFDNNVAVEIRLRDALAFDLICPFHYFGITDVQGVDYRNLKKKPGDSGYLDELANLLMVGRRVDYIIEKMKFYDHDGDGKAKVLGFCATVEHAQYMADEFNKRFSQCSQDYAVALSGNDSSETRESYIKKLENDNDPLSVIFTVDIFNEGVDIPSVNTILMLRPTESSIIFVQQLGRGLRKLPNKEFVTVLDFIGNYKKSFLMAIALNGKNNYDRDSLKVSVKNDFSDIPGSTHIHMDRITKQQILKQLEHEKFYALKYLKDNYFSFKKINGNKIPMLTDFLKQDGAYDPLNFTKPAAFNTYFDFVKSVEAKNDPVSWAFDEPTGYCLLKFVHKFLLPSKRPYELVILKSLIEDKNFTLQTAAIEKKLEKYIDCPSADTLNHAVNVLSGTYFDKNENSTYEKIILIKDKDTLSLSKYVIEFLTSDSPLVPWVNDAVEYGLRRYESEFGTVNYGTPFFKLYAEYSMRDTAPLTNYEKTHSSFRGQGLITAVKSDYLLFVDLYKEEGIKDSVNYDDRLLSSKVFQWQSPNSTKQNSDIGQNLIHNKDNKVNLHLFVRKYPSQEGLTAPFIYLGKVNTIEDTVKGNKPITMKFLLENEVPDQLYTELTTIVDSDSDSDTE